MIGQLGTSSAGSESNNGVSHQAATQPFMEPTTSSGPETDYTAAPLVIKHKSLDGLKASSAILHSMMLEHLTPLHEVLQRLLLRPAMGTVGICATWTLTSAKLLLPLGKRTPWGCSWAQSKTYDPGGRGRPGLATCG